MDQEATGARSVRFQYLVGIGVWLLVVDFVFVGVMGHRLPRPLGVAGSWAFLGVSAALLAALGAQRLARSREQARLLSLQQGILHALGALTEPSLAVLPAEQLLEEMLKRLVDTLGVQTATIYLFSEDGSEFVSPASVGKGGAVTKGHRLAVNRGVAGRIASERQPITSDNPAEIGELASELLGLASVAGCPIVVEDRLIGICVVGTTAPKPFSTVDIQLLQLVADRVGAGIERSRLDEAERRSRLAAEHAQGHVLLLGRASETLSTAIDDYEPNLAALVDVVVPDFADWCAVDVVDQAGTRRRLSLRHGEDRSPEGSAELLQAFPFLEAAIDRATTFGHSEFLVRPAGDGATPSAAIACVVVPIRVRGRTLGLITFANDPGRDAYDRSDVAAAEEVAIRTAITAERVMLYRELGGREARWRAVVEAAPAGIVEIDLDGRVLVWNQFAATMFGWGTDLPSSTANPSLPVDTTRMLSALWAQAAAGEEIVDAQVTVTLGAGEDRDLAVSVAPLRASDGTVQAVLMLAADVSERRRLQERLREAQRMDALGQVAGGVAHDFNNLLTVITGYADLLTRRLTLGEEDQRLFDNIRNAAERAAVLTGQLLTISRRQVPKPVVLAPDEALRSVADVLQRILGIDIAVVWHLEAGDGSVLIDPGRFEQLILNLAINARDAMPDGGRLTIATSATIATGTLAGLDLAGGPQVCITVADTGVGMDAETRRRCFEPFFTTKDRSKGTGLGLAAVQGIVEEAGGVIAVDSQPGQGTTFTLRFPSVDLGEPVADTGPIAASPLVRGSETVLVVDDEIDVRQLISKILRHDGYLVLEASSGAEAIRIAERWEGPIELLVTDAVMPGVRGPELATAVRALRPRIRVLLISGYTDRPNFPAEVVSDPLGFLAKPFKPSELADRVRKILDRCDPAQNGSPRPEPS